ncbi:signal peptide protein [Afipia sp. P52-10]|uniref:hypothetical protein n=1 Tax=Afipia sp. P52-10 TaxID=1429916 RepID=UPI0003DF0F0A|nr:hypothetical protein [Afipia sp. P52-10]ETR75694.1 signal peptide protein [Afipia sp. P52-10]
MTLTLMTLTFLSRPLAALACAALCAGGLMAVWPQAREAAAIFAAKDDPAVLSDLQLRRAVKGDPALIDREIQAALAQGDADLAQSFVDVADAQNLPVSADLLVKVTDAVAEQRSVAHLAGRFASGFVTGEADDLASLSGTVTGDLFTFGDIRDMVREGRRYALGEQADTLVLGLAAVGLAITAGTYTSVGTVSPARAGLSLFKGARKSARLSEGLAHWARRSTADVIDTDGLRRAVSNVSVTRPGESLGALKAAVRTEKAGLLVAAVKDVGRVGEKAGARAALDVVKVADNPKELAKAAKLAESKGSQTRALLKVLGRGALLLAAGAFNLASWLLSALLFLFGILASIKSLTERITHRLWLRKRERRARQAVAAA